MRRSQYPRFIMIGGFLGAGKTTTVSGLASRLESEGQRVAIVTNDQASDLVDTNSLRAQGFQVGEVAGSCFCCNFNGLTSAVEQLGVAQRPNVILAEPVGSCTDLVATVIRPLQHVYTQRFDIAPYGVIVKPSHGLRILKGQASAGFSPQAEYIFRKQLEEADFIIINRIDELRQAEVDELERLVDDEFPGRPVLRMSAKTGAGFDALCEFLDQEGEFGRRVMDVDYDVYAEGEAELGWLNSQVRIQSNQSIDLDEFLMSLTCRLRDQLASVAAETAHLKTIGMSEGSYGVANLISSFTEPQLSLPSAAMTRQANVVVNARVAIAPESLTEIVRRAVHETARSANASASIDSLQSFRPGRPVPTFRI